MATNVTTGAETNLIGASQMAKAREIDFVQQFTHKSLAKLIEVLGVTRKIPMMEGTTMYVYTTTGALANNGAVPEGEIIPLSRYATTKTPVGEITLKKWRKAASAEAIKKSGYEAAVVETDAALLKDVQGAVRSDFFSLLTGSITGSMSMVGNGLQAALAEAWGRLQVLFEDDAAEAVYFLNPLDVAEYLGGAQVTMQTVFGMNYIENFLGLGTVIMASGITRGTFVATAKENIIMYYLTMNGDIAQAFSLTADETGYIGIKSGYQNEERAQIESLVMDGIQFFVEYAGGVIKGNISPSIALDKSTATVAAGSTVSLTATTKPSGETVTWTSDDTSTATVSSGTVTGVAAGSATITASITVGGVTKTDKCVVTVTAAA